MPLDASYTGALPAYLFKSEPNVWSWTQQSARGDVGEPWNGVRNFQARNLMRTMQIGERGFFYHSQTERALVGIVEVCGDYAPDPTDETERFGLVHLRAVCALPRPVTLNDVKLLPECADMPLLRQSRLSVSPVPAAAARALLRAAGLRTSTSCDGNKLRQ